MSSRKCIIGLIRLAGFDDTETQGDEVPHGGAECGFLGLAPCHEAFVKGLNVRVITDGHHRRHIEHRADAGGTGLGQAGATHEGGTGLAFHGHQPDIGCQWFS